VKHALFLCVCMFVVRCSGQSTVEQQEVVSVKATILRRALMELRATPDDRVAQIRYLEAFPKTYKEYRWFFDLGQPLYDGHVYVDPISALAKNHERTVGNILVNLSKDAHYEADAPSYLQEATCRYAGEHTKTFLTLLNQLPRDRQNNLITFLADVENHRAYPEYQIVIDHLKVLGEDMLAKKFELARSKREKQPHD